MIVLEEVWRPCCQGYYEASSLGRVRRVRGWRRLLRNGRQHEYPSVGTILKPQLRNRDGRLYVCVCIDGHRLTRGIHQLVAEAFLGIRPAGMEANHINGDKLDNRSENLEYVTPSANKAHAARLGLVKGPRDQYGERSPSALLTADDVREIRARRRRGDSLKSIAADYPVGPSAIDYAARGVTWGHVR